MLYQTICTTLYKAAKGDKTLYHSFTLIHLLSAAVDVQLEANKL